MKFMRKSLSLLLAVVLTCSLRMNTLAMENPKDVSEQVEVTSDDINVSNKEKNEFNQISENLANELAENTNPNAVKEVINEYVSNTDIGDIQEDIVEEISDALDEDVKNDDLPSVEMSEDFKEEFENTYQVDDNTIVTINPLYIEITDIKEEDGEEFVEEPEENSMLGFLDDLFSLKVYAASKTKTKSYSESKAYYSWVGTKVFTIGLTCNFYYNGTKAWYKSGFDGWYKRATGSIWQVSNWKEKREQSGKSYIARCSGNFHFGLEYRGIGLIIQDYYISHIATCNKNGSVSISRSMR